MERGYVSRRQMAEHRRAYPDQWERYDFACRWIRKGDRVVDLACGSGFGTFLLSKGSTERALGLDVSSEALDWAQAEFGDTADFKKWDDSLLEELSGKFDVAVSFETLEHMNEQAGRVFVANLRQMLRPGGTLIISTPLTESQSRYAPSNPFHIREYSWDELGALLSTEFQVRARYSQVSRLARLRAAFGETAAATEAVVAPQRGAAGLGAASFRRKLVSWLRQRTFWRAGSFLERQCAFAGVQVVVAVRSP